MNFTVQQILNEKSKNRLMGILEHYYDYFDRVVDYTTEFEGWMRIAPDRESPAKARTKGQLDGWRDLGRRLDFSNPFAINGLQNMVNFTVGTGFRYRINDPKKRSTYAGAIERAHDFWRQWIDEEDWDDQERESMLRSERDGEAFVRLYPDYGGKVLVRQTDPMHIEGDSIPNMPSSEFGIITGSDQQKPLAYIVDKTELVDPAFMLHVKRNVDSDVWRGIPTFLPCLEHLERAKKLLEVMSKMVEVQAALAAVREHPEGVSGTRVDSFLNAQTGTRAPTTDDGETIRQHQWQPGTIIDVPAGQKYHFPSAGKSAEDVSHAINALLRAAAARVSSPEFMFSMNAADSNYASLKAADHPGIRANQVRQVFYGKRYKKLFKQVIRLAVVSGLLPQQLLDPSLQWSVVGPAVKSSDHFSETRSNEMLHKRGVLSARTWADREGLDYDRELKRNQEDDVEIPEAEEKPDPAVAMGARTGESIGKGDGGAKKEDKSSG